MAQGEETGIDIVPRIIEQRFVIVSIQNFLDRGFEGVGEEEILVITLDLINLFSQPKFLQMLTEHVKDIVDERPIRIFTNSAGMIGGASIVLAALLWSRSTCTFKPLDTIHRMKILISFTTWILSSSCKLLNISRAHDPWSWICKTTDIFSSHQLLVDTVVTKSTPTNKLSGRLALAGVAVSIGNVFSVRLLRARPDAEIDAETKDQVGDLVALLWDDQVFCLYCGLSNTYGIKDMR